MYSASVEESTMVFCTLLCQETAAPLMRTIYPVLDHLVCAEPQSVSAYAMIPSLDLPYVSE